MNIRGFVGSALALVGGFCGCQYFTNVVVPAHDSTPPGAWAGVYDVAKGEYVALGDGAGVEYTTTDPTATYLAVAAGYDQGGVKWVTESQGVWVAYCKGAAAGYGETVSVADQSQSQRGTVGSTVSNGLWVYDLVRFDQCPAQCPIGWPIDHLAFTWDVATSDFANFTAYGTGEIDYYPP
jgi:hypothetical protein